MVASRYIKNGKSSLSVDVGRSKKLLLKLPNKYPGTLSSLVVARDPSKLLVTYGNLRKAREIHHYSNGRFKAAVFNFD